MSNQVDSQTETAPSEAAAGLTVFAAVMMMMVGAFQAIQGIIALANESFYVVGEKYVFQFDVTTWGWIHLLLGVLVGVAGYFVLQAKVWARTVGVIVAVVSAVFNFAWLPYYPVWSILIIALNVFVIWALTVRGRDVTRV